MRKIVLWSRRIVAALVFAGFLALFAGCWVKQLSFLAKAQFWPSVLAGSMAVAVAIVAVAVLAGRWYCSVCCPLGILQDIAFRLKKHNAQKLASLKARRIVRLVAFALFMAIGFAGLGFSWIEPYGLFGRIVTGAWTGCTLGLAIVALAVWKGRVWCNWICPIGTVLGAFSRFAPFRLKIDAEKCIGCRKCERTCRASAIAIQGKGEGGEIDSTLCVQCRDCTVACPKGAIGSKLGCSKPEAEPAAKTGGEGLTRRSFLIGAAATTAAFAAEAAEEKIFDGGLADVTEPGIDARNASLKPAGSHSIKNFKSKCVGCQLCVKACPNKVLRPSMRLKDFGQPEMAFDKGYCTIDCHRCGKVCPAGAIEAIPAFMKPNIHIGEAVWHQDRCLAATEGVNCTACYRHCPVKAIERIDGPNGAKIPIVNADKCIGCGACEHVCPARPMPGMTVRANERHREVWPTNLETLKP